MADSTISIGFKIEDAAGGLRKLTVDAEALRRAMRSRMSSACTTFCRSSLIRVMLSLALGVAWAAAKRSGVQPARTPTGDGAAGGETCRRHVPTINYES